MRRPVAVLAACLTLVGAGTAAYLVGASTTTASQTPGIAVEPVPSPQQPVAASSPETAAVLWLNASHARSWQDPSPHAWLHRVLPLTTEKAAEEMQAEVDQARDADWPAFVGEQCTTELQRPDSVIPAEAPTGPDLAYVQVSGEVVTECVKAAGRVPEARAVTATVKIRRTPEGWRVAEQLF